MLSATMVACDLKLMSEDATQPESGSQVEDSKPADLGLLNEGGLAAILRDRFLNEEEATTTPVDKQEQETTEEEPEVIEEVAEEEPEVAETVEAEDKAETNVQKRINKLVAAKKQAEAEVEKYKQSMAQLQAEADSLKGSLQTPVEQRSPANISDVVSSLNSLDEIDKEYHNATNVIYWCEENPDGGELAGTELTGQEVRQMKIKAMRIRDSELPFRRNYLMAEAQTDKQVEKDFPWLKDPSSPDYQVAQSILKAMPEIKRFPDWKRTLGVFILGEKEYQRINKATPNAVVKKAPPQPGVKASPPIAGNQSSAVKAKFAKDYSSADGLVSAVKALGFI